jgi:hypothetical protein
MPMKSGPKKSKRYEKLFSAPFYDANENRIFFGRLFCELNFND